MFQNSPQNYHILSERINWPTIRNANFIISTNIIYLNLKFPFFNCSIEHFTKKRKPFTDTFFSVHPMLSMLYQNFSLYAWIASNLNICPRFNFTWIAIIIQGVHLTLNSLQWLLTYRIMARRLAILSSSKSDISSSKNI